MNNEVALLTRNIDSAFASAKYSDFTIHCGDRAWKVHKLIICSQSEYFQRLCDGAFEVSIYWYTSLR